MACITIHEDYKLWKYGRNWTREFWIKGFFQFFYLIETELFQFLTYFCYSVPLALYGAYITWNFKLEKGGLMAEEGCGKMAIFKQNSNPYTPKNVLKIIWDQ